MNDRSLVTHYHKGDLVRIRDTYLPSSCDGCQNMLGIFMFEEPEEGRVDRYKVYIQDVGVKWFASIEMNPVKERERTIK